MALPTLTGTARLVADPEIRFTASGKQVAEIRLAFNSRRKNERGEWVDGDTFFVRGTAWEALAEHIADSLQKGTEVIVTGDLRTDSWEDKAGEKRQAPSLLIRSIGPSLAWATARVERATRDGSSAPQTARQQPPSGPAPDPWAAAGPAYPADDNIPF